MVWARGGIATTVCPKSAITPESEALLEEYVAWKRIGPAALGELSARQVDAFAALESAAERERKHGERHTRGAA